MKMPQLVRGVVSLTALIFIVVSCSDFGNTPRRQGDSGPAPQGPVGKNPFPPGFEKPNEGDFTDAKMLVNLGTNLVVKDVRNFRLKAEVLRATLQASCESKMTPSAQTSAKNAFRDAMLAFHGLAAVTFGPLAEDKGALQSRIYAWPFINTCGIDQEVEALTREAAKPVSALGVNLRGLGAIEYLLFEPNLKSTCNARAFPLVKAWTEKPAVEKAVDRCALAERLSQDVMDAAVYLEKRWDVEEGNYSKSMIDGSVYPDMKEAVTAVVHGMFAFEKLKDERLGRPLGLHKLCTSDSWKCPENAEHPYSGLAFEGIRMQFDNFKEIFWGSRNPAEKAFGIDDLLISRGYPGAVDELRVAMERLDVSLAAVEAEGTTLQEQIDNMLAEDCRATTITDRRVPVCAMFQDLRVITTLFKTDVLTMLSLRAPPGYQGDND